MNAGMFDGSNRLLNARRRLEHNKNNDLSREESRPFIGMFGEFGKDPLAPKSEEFG